MEKQIKDINLAIKSGAYLSALALALTIPDICGKNMLVSKGEKKPTNKERYIQWCEKYLPELWKFGVTGEHIYRLRCSFLHENTASIENFNICRLTAGFYITLREFTQSGIDSNGEKHCLRYERTFDIDISQFCNAICDAARAFCKEFEIAGKPLPPELNLIFL